MPRAQSVLFGVLGLLFLIFGITPLALALLGIANASGSPWLAFVISPLLVLVGLFVLWTERVEIDLHRHVITFRDSIGFFTFRRRSIPLPDRFHVNLALWHASGRYGRVPRARISLEANGVSHCLFDDAADHAVAQDAASQLSTCLTAPLTVNVAESPHT